MKPIKIDKRFLSGTGVGSSDLLIGEISISETIDSVDIGSLIGEGQLVDELKQLVDYKYNMTAKITPGYFYVSDKEFYYYNKKVTQFSKAKIGTITINKVTTNETFASIKLKDYPDSINSYYESSELKLKGGAAPIIIEVFSSSELSNNHVIFDEAVFSDGLDGKLSYRRTIVTEEPLVYKYIEGEDGTYPGYVSPLNNYEKCAEDYITTGILQEDKYYYDYDTNRIIFIGNPNEYLNKEFAIHWESMNEEFRIPELNLNPIETLPENNILCLSLDGVNDESVKQIVIDSDKSIVGINSTVSLGATCFSEYGNRVSNSKIYCLVDFENISPSGYIIKDKSYIHDSKEWWESSLVTNPISKIPCILSASGVTINNIDSLIPINSKVFHMCPGYLEDIKGNKSQLIECTSDINGYCVFNYISPSYIYDNYNIRISLFSEDGNISVSKIIGITKNQNDYLLGGETNIVYIEEAIDNSIILPDAIFSPNDVKICPISIFIDSVYSNTPIPWIRPNSIDFTNTDYTPKIGYLLKSSLYQENAILNKGKFKASFSSLSGEVVISTSNFNNHMKVDGRIKYV